MFALIIGISRYKSMSLRSVPGAIHDALAIQSYLMDELGVDAYNIQLLFDEQATRRGIIDALWRLKHADNIRRGDAILIYYAGHCVQVPGPASWATESKENLIQCIVPYDFDEHQGIYGIPNRTFDLLIQDIMRLRGDNIVCPGERIFMYISNEPFPLDRHPRLQLLRIVWRFVPRLTRSLRCKRVRT